MPGFAYDGEDPDGYRTVPQVVDFIAQSKFRQRFEAKGRFQTYLETIPSHVIMHPAAAFIGLKSMAQRADFG